MAVIGVRTCGHDTSAMYVLITYLATSVSLSKPFSLNPNEVVRTRGGLSCLRRKLMISRKPKTPSWFWLPTVTNVVLTFVATPVVYWISRLCHRQSVA